MEPDLNNIPDEDYDPSAAILDTGKFGEVQHGNQFQEQGCFYSGSLIEDCASVVKQAALQAHNDFLLANGLGDGKMKAREAAVPESYMEFGR